MTDNRFFDLDPDDIRVLGDLEPEKRVEPVDDKDYNIEGCVRVNNTHFVVDNKDALYREAPIDPTQAQAPQESNHTGCLGWWTVIVGLIMLTLLTVFLTNTCDRQQDKPAEPKKKPDPIIRVDTNTTPSLVVSDTVINDMHLCLVIPINTQASLRVGNIDTTNADELLVLTAADIRRDNGKIVGAYVIDGEVLAWGLAKKGYCAIINDSIQIGVAENSPLFEQATQTEGSFFRQYAAVKDGEMVENNPKNTATRRALCMIDNRLCVVITSDQVLMNDFSNALVQLGVSDAILLSGGGALGWYRNNDGKVVMLGNALIANTEYNNYIVFGKR